MKKLTRRKQWVEDFLNGLIDKEQAELDLSKDPLLRKELEFELRLKESLSDDELLRFEEILEQLRVTKRDDQRNMSKEPKLIYRVVMAAASLAFIVLTYVIIQTQANRNHNVDYLAEKAEFPQEIYRGQASTLDSVKMLTNLKDYERASILMESIIDTSRTDILQARGITRYNTGRYSDAIHDFNAVMSDNDNLYTLDALWYRALSYYHLGEDKKASADLVVLLDDKDEYRAKALQVLRKIDKRPK